MDEAHDDEWEYEYSHDETEDLYFTLDLTTHVPDAVPIHQVSRNGRRPAKAVEKARETVTAGEAGDTAASQLQILNLHEREPLVQLDKQIFSCNWHTDLGTQFHVAEPGTTTKAIWSGHVVDVVGISQTRLLGRPVTLQPRVVEEPAAPSPANEVASGEAMAVDDDSGASDLTNLRPGEQLKVPKAAIKTAAMAQLASFFEKLSAIKLKKGENDIIPVAGVKYYRGPANKEELRKRALASAEVLAATPSTTAEHQKPVARGTKRAHAESSVIESSQPAFVAPSMQPAMLSNGRQTMDLQPAQALQQRAGTHLTLQTPNPTVQYSLPGSYAQPVASGPLRPMGPAIPWHALSQQTPSMAAILTSSNTPSVPEISHSRPSPQSRGSQAPG